MKTNLKKYTSATILLLNSLSAIAQTQNDEKSQVAKFPEWASDPMFYLIVFIFFIMSMTIYVLYKSNLTLLNILSPKSVETIQKKPVKQKKESFFRKTYLKLIDSVPVEKEKDVLLDHDYDGIKELDNNLPPWWKYGFYFTIIFAVVYMIYYHAAGGKLQAEEYKDELTLAAQQKEERLLASADNVNEENVSVLTEPVAISGGKETFTKLCVACHRGDGGGQVGPNLTDEYWLHGGGIKNVFKTITYGVPEKGMVSWKSQLSPKQIQQVASYILSLQGTNPSGAKEPQGDKWIEEVVTKQDSSLKIIDKSAMASNQDTAKGNKLKR
jgi:cytochrome c oxidase cbb3-type subunit 3